MAKAPVKSELLAALDFVKLAAKDGGIVQITDGMLSVVTSIMRAYHPTSEDVRLTTDLDKYHSAIKTIGDKPYSCTVGNTIKITAGKFKIELPILPVDYLYKFDPIDISNPCDDSLIDALVKASSVTKAGDTTMSFACVYPTENQTFVGTNGRVFVEVWHGNEGLTYGVLIPTDFINILGKLRKANRKATHCYIDDKIMAVRYADNSVITSQLFVEQYVNWKQIAMLMDKASAAPEGLDEIKAAFDQLAPFGEVYVVSAGETVCGNASVQMLSSHAWAIAVKDWALACDMITKLDAKTLNNMAVFGGPMLRGCIVKCDEDAVARLSR